MLDNVVVLIGYGWSVDCFVEYVFGFVLRGFENLEGVCCESYCVCFKCNGFMV